MNLMLRFMIFRFCSHKLHELDRTLYDLQLHVFQWVYTHKHGVVAPQPKKNRRWQISTHERR